MILSSFYQAIMDRLMEKIPEIQYFDLWNNQLDSSADEEDIKDLEFNFPALFLEYQPMEPQTLGNRKQAINTEFAVRIYSEVLMETSSLESAKERTLGLDHLKLIDQVFAALQGFNGEGFGSIGRVGIIPDLDHGPIKGDITIFRVRLTDTAAVLPKTTKKPADIEQSIEGEFYKKEE